MRAFLSLLLYFSLFLNQNLAFSFPIRGSATLSTSILEIDKYHPLYEEGNTYSLNTILMGTLFNENFTGILNLNKKEKDEIEIENIFIEVPLRRTLLGIGDFYLKFSPFSLDNLKIRGVNFQYNFKDRFSLIACYGISKEKREAYNEDINNNGVLDLGEDKNKNNILDVYDGIFAQDIKAAQINLSPFRYLKLRLNYFQIFDQPNSIKDPKKIYPLSIATPILNHNFGIEGSILLFKSGYPLHKIFFESHYSKFFQNNQLREEFKFEKAYKITFTNKIGGISSRLSYFKINPDYITAGNPFLLNDQEGFLFSLLYQKRYLSIELKGDLFKDNLKEDKDKLTTKNICIRSSISLKPDNWPKIRIFHKILNKKSDFKENLSPKKIEKNEEGFGLGLSQNLSLLNYLLNFQFSKYDNKSIYKTEFKPPKYQNSSISINLNFPFKKKFFSLNIYSIYNQFKNISNKDKEENYQGNIKFSLKLIPRKLLFFPILEIRRSYFNKMLMYETINWTLEWKYYLSTNKMFLFSYKNMKKEDKKSKEENYNIHIIKFETTIVL